MARGHRRRAPVRGLGHVAVEVIVREDRAADRRDADGRAPAMPSSSMTSAISRCATPCRSPGSSGCSVG